MKLVKKSLVLLFSAILLVPFASSVEAKALTEEVIVSSTEARAGGIGLFKKKKKKNKYNKYYKVAARKKRQAMWHRRSLLRSR